MPAAASSSPADVARAVGAGVVRLVGGRLSDDQREQQLDELAALYAEHTDVRHPFAPLGDEPLRTRAELRAHFAQSRSRASAPERFEQVGIVVHETADPEVIVIEFSYEITRNGERYSVPVIIVMRVRDGEIVESRDYAHHIEMARAASRIDELASALRNTPLGSK